MYCIIKCIVQGKKARDKNADLRRLAQLLCKNANLCHPSSMC